MMVWLTASAQFKHPVYSDQNAGYSVGIQGRYRLSSTAMTSNFLWGIYRGRQLSRGLREKVSNHLGPNSKVGADLDYGLYAKHLPDSSKGIGWFVNIADRTHANAKFPKDLFDLVMFGNAMFAGKTAELSGIEMNLLTYKQFEAGIIKTVATENGKWNLGLGLSFLAGNRNLRIKVDKAYMFTDVDGEYLEGEIHGNVRMSSLKSSTYFDANGLGFSGSLNVSYRTEKFGIGLQIVDLGFLTWSKQLRHIELDSVFFFEGINVNLFSANGDPFSSIDLDSVVGGFATEKDGSKYSTILPTSFDLEGSYMLNAEKWKLYVGVQYRIAPAYVPFVYVGTGSPLPKGFYIDGRLAYGGFGSWHIGLEVRKKFSDLIEIRLGTNNLEGYVLPMFGTSQSAYLQIAAFF